MDKKNHIQKLGNPNEPSVGQCYAPVEHGKANIKNKKHFDVGEDYPQGWIQVDCSLERHKKLRHPIAVWRNGKVEIIPLEKIKVPDYPDDSEL